jgi:Amidohydrolase family
MKTLLNIAAALSFFSVAYAQVPSPAPAQKLPIVIQGGTLHIGNGTVIENGEIRIANGKIEYIGNISTNAATATNIELIKADGKHLYPSLILLNSGLGLTEVEAVRATVDVSEVGDFVPHVRSLIAYNTDSEFIPVTRSNGILLTQVAPHGGYICGTSSVVQLDAWNWEDATYQADNGIYMNFPSSFNGGGRWEGDAGMQKADKYKEELDKIESFLQDAANYAQLAAPTPQNLKLAAMKGLFDSTKRLFIRVNFAKDIITAVKLAKKYNITHLCIVGGYESPLITDFLKSHNVAVVLNESFNVPIRMDDDIDTHFKAAAQLQAAGVLFSMAYTSDDGSVRNSRNLPFAMGMACGFGLDKEKGLEALTLNAAKILGIESKTGSLEVGKDANLVISTGDILDIRGNQVSQAFIQGRMISLDNKQQRLNKKFMEKYRSEKSLERE